MTSTATFFVLAAALLLMVVGVVLSEVYRKRLSGAIDDIGSLVRAVTGRKTPPMVFALQPVTGVTTGGTEIAITGRHFDRGTIVKLRGNLALGTRLISEEEIRATTPPGTIGDAEVIVENRDGERDVRAAGFRYVLPDPVVRGVTPNAGAPGLSRSLLNLAERGGRASYPQFTAVRGIPT